MPQASEPISLRVEASSHCQLKCPSCPTAKGKIKDSIGGGFMRPAAFEKLLDENPSVAHIELSNWGEIFLNPWLPDICRIAYERDVILTASNGVNLNTCREAALEAVVKYRFRHMTCSIDGASQATYEQYRRKGNFDTVIRNIRTINEHKKRYKTEFPILLWQYIAFGHNEHEIDQAKALADELGMMFYVKLSWDEGFSPIRDKDLVRKHTKGGVTSRSEYRKKHNQNYIQKSICRQLWDQPQLNFDGEVLGCCANIWGSFGNAFDDGLVNVLEGDKLRYAKEMVMGRAPRRDDMPCIHCKHYHTMEETGAYVSEADLKSPLIQGPGHEALRRIGRGVVRAINRNDRIANTVVKQLVFGISKVMIK